jgi:AIPR protein
MATLIKMKANSFRKIQTPFEENGKFIYISTVNIRDIVPQIEDWRDVNVRDPRTKSDVFREITHTLEDDIENFIFKNRWMTILAESVIFDNTSNTVEIVFEEKSKHWLIDGWHTYQAIREFQDSWSMGKWDGFVKVEFLQWIDDTEDIANIIWARNTSRQVQSSSLENLLWTFDEIKEVLKNEKYSNLIEYSEYDASMDIDKKINIQEILSYLVCFDIDEYPISDAQNSHPIFTCRIFC